MPPHLAGAPPGPAAQFTVPFAALAALVAVAAVALYLAAAARLRRRGDAWPRARDASFAAGGTLVAAAAMVPVPGPAPFTAHMVQHLLAAMAAPVALVVARPLTLTLRLLRPGGARRALLAVAHGRPARWLCCPPVAALLHTGGLWLLYRTPLMAAGHHHPVLRAALDAHVLAAGLLFAFCVCGLDPVRRPWSLAWRGGTLLAAGAAHAVLAKWLYAAPPPGLSFTAADLHTGAQVMYYGGDLADLGLAAVLAVQWYATTGRARARLRRPGRARHAA
ncbi:cytochrome c oxidase assembly protein [Streptomyces ficellus]|uniref:Cytochrome c oxidase assembly protein n=1 Tax=Streptomyces ficellus TaxID=1977088 RepID=A0ABT7Z500_9ACTN|nr:cytochrome c oxidase assembly protein [Streptomyces ficellus]MDN3294342.1 cytochrome c oxidase assembly protein [Streptomyces ficellus]